MPKTRKSKALDSVDEHTAKKLNTFLKDFDAQVDMHIENMNVEGQKLLDSIQNALTVQIASLPLATRNMTVEEFLANEGAIDADEYDRVENVLESIVNNFQSKSKAKASDHSKKKSIQAKSSTKVKKACTPLRNTRTKPPIVTPKFDIRTGVTPATCRRPKPGEILLSTSGSPIINLTGTKRDKKVPSGENLTLAELQLMTAKKSENLDPNTEKSLIEAQIQIANILKQSMS